MCKMIRVMKHAQNVSKPYNHLPEFKVKQEMFLPAAIAAIDSGSHQPMEWTKHFDFIRGAGYPEAWEKVPLRSARVPEKAQSTSKVVYHGQEKTSGLSVNGEEEETNGVATNGHGKTDDAVGNGEKTNSTIDIKEKAVNGGTKPEVVAKPFELPNGTAKALAF